MLIQPYVENAVKHGLMHKKPRGGKIEISFERENGSLICRVTDDGVGRAKAATLISKHDLNHESMGMRITQERLDILNANSDNQVSVVVKDLEDKTGEASGTCVEVYVPLKWHQLKT